MPLCPCCEEHVLRSPVEITAKIRMIEWKIGEHPEFYTTNMKDPILEKAKRSDSMHGITIRRYPGWLFVKLYEYVDKPEVFDSCISILYRRVATRPLSDKKDRALSSKSTITPKIFQWALEYAGPSWEIMHMSMLQMYNRADKSKMRHVYEESIKAANRVYDQHQEPFDARLGTLMSELIHCYHNVNVLSRAWDSEDGVKFWAWSLEYDQTHPHQDPTHLINIMTISSSLMQSSLNMFLDRYWENGQGFLRRVKSFLPTALKIAPNQLISVESPEYYMAVHVFVEWMAWLVEERHFSAIFISKNLIDCYYAGLQILQKQIRLSQKQELNTKGLEKLRSTILIYVFIVLTTIHDHEFTTRALRLLGDPLAKCMYEGVRLDEFASRKMKNFLDHVDELDESMVAEQRKDVGRIVNKALYSQSLISIKNRKAKNQESQSSVFSNMK